MIFLDVSMPGMDGFAACSQIHATVLNRITPVVFITNHGDTASRARVAVAGGCGFIPKPVLASQIALVALSYILQGRLARQLPELETPSSLAGSGLEPALPEFAGATAVDHTPQQYPWDLSGETVAGALNRVS